METSEHDKPDKKPEVEHLAEQSAVYTDYKAYIKYVKENATKVLYFLFFVILMIGLWINLEEGRFPFNVKFIADRAYSKRKWGTPLMAFGIVFGLAFTYLLVRIGVLTVLDNTVYAGIVNVFKKKNLIVKIKTKTKVDPDKKDADEDKE